MRGQKDPVGRTAIRPGAASGDLIDAKWKNGGSWTGGEGAAAVGAIPARRGRRRLVANVEARVDLQDAYHHVAGDLKI